MRSRLPTVSSAHLGGEPRAIWIILALAFTLRLIWTLIVESAIATDFMYDATYYFLTGKNIATGAGFVTTPGVPAVYFPPGYPLILASVFVVTGPKMLVPSLINSFAGAATCWITFKLGARVYGLQAGLMAAALLAFWPSHVYASSATISEIVFTFFLTLAIYVFYLLETTERGESRRAWILLGILLSCTSLVRGAGLLFVSVLWLALFLNRGLSRKACTRAVLLIIPILAINGLWIVRNQISMGSPVILGTSGAWSFFNAHNEKADGGQSWTIDRYREDLFGEHLLGETSIEDAVKLQSLQIRHAATYMVTHPMEELYQIPKRIYKMHRRDDWPLAWIGRRSPVGDTQQKLVEYVHPALDPWLPGIANTYYFVLLPMGLIGLVLGLAPTYRQAWVVPLSVIYFHGLHGVLFFGAERFHAPFLPELALGAGLLLAIIRQKLLGETLESD